MDISAMDNQQSNTSTIKQLDNTQIEYSRSHSSSLLLSTNEINNNDNGYSDDETETNTQTFYYQQLKLTPVPKKKVIDKNRLIGILQNLPNESSTNIINEEIEMSHNNNQNDIELMHEEKSNVSIQKQHTHSRKFSSQMSFPDIDKIINEEDEENKDTLHRTHSYSQSRHSRYKLI